MFHVLRARSCDHPESIWSGMRRNTECIQSTKRICAFCHWPNNLFILSNFNGICRGNQREREAENVIKFSLTFRFSFHIKLQNCSGRWNACSCSLIPLALHIHVLLLLLTVSVAAAVVILTLLFIRRHYFRCIHIPTFFKGSPNPEQPKRFIFIIIYSLSHSVFSKLKNL